MQMTSSGMDLVNHSLVTNLRFHSHSADNLKIKEWLQECTLGRHTWHETVIE
jgi:hypothetical protein